MSTRSQIINLLEQLRDDFGIAYLFVAHDLTIVRHISHRIVVMYRGQIVEIGDAEQVSAHPQHPYTKARVAAAPVPHPAAQRQRRIDRQAAAVSVTRTTDTEHGCAYANRCPNAMAICSQVRPVLRPVTRSVAAACHLYDNK